MLPPDLNRPYVRRAELVDKLGTKAVYDGDGTVHVYIDQGFYTERFRIKLRLAEIDAPEIRGTSGEEKRLAIESRDRLFELLSAGPFWIESVKKGARGRWIAKIWLDDGIYVNDLMVKEGLAVYREY